MKTTPFSQPRIAQQVTMNQPIRSKTCAKTYKTAELKVLKILNKIDSLKLSNSYISRLDIPRSNEKKGFGVSSARCTFLTAGLIFVLMISGRWVYTEVLGSRVSLIIT